VVGGIIVLVAVILAETGHPGRVAEPAPAARDTVPASSVSQGRA
jgi:hypothetical protein